VLPSQECDSDKCLEANISVNADFWFQGDIVKMQEDLIKMGWTTTTTTTITTASAESSYIAPKQTEGKQNISYFTTVHIIEYYL
jgi:hypothetical protein